MASSGQTEKLNLCQFSTGDAPSMDDWNDDNLKIDNAIKSVVENGVHNPYIDGGTWWVWDSVEGAYVDSGESAHGIQGLQGVPGEDGRGIVSVNRTSGTGAAGTTDTYTITYSDGTTSTFAVYNGANGTGAGDMLASDWASGGAIKVAKGGLGNTTGNTDSLKTAFTAATTRANIATGETHATLFGKIAKWFADLGAMAFKATVATSDIDANAVTSAKLATMAAKTVKGNLGTSTATPSDVTMLDVIEYGLSAGTTATSIDDAEYIPISVSATSTKKITWAYIKTVLAEVFGAKTDVTALQTAQTVWPTGGTAPALTIADTSVTAYAAGLRRTIQAHADATEPTLNFNSKGAVALYEYTGKRMSLKAGQVVDVYYNGTSFFGVSVGGSGVAFPSTPAAGDTSIYDKPGIVIMTSATYAAAGTGYGITAVKAGVYRIRYTAGCTTSDGTGYAKLQKNGVDVASSEVSGSNTSTTKVIDVSLSAGDALRLFVRAQGAYSFAGAFTVSVLAADIQTQINTMVTAL